MDANRNDVSPGPLEHRSVAVVGGGISGLACAQTLRASGADVVVFEKSRGVGGRTATRRAADSLRFDHGAQYFTAREPLFVRSVERWCAQGVTAQWTPRLVSIEASETRLKVDQPRRYVGVPTMSALARHLAQDVTVHTEVRITSASHSSAQWFLTDAIGQSHGPYESLVLSMPAAQTADLLGDHRFGVTARQASMTPCWAVLVAFDERVGVAWDAAFVHDSALAWASRDGSKPGRTPLPECWVLHAAGAWSAGHRDALKEDVCATLLEAFASAAGSLPLPCHVDAHRWLYADVSNPIDERALFDAETRLAVCGDWVGGGRVEGAFTSGVAAAQRLIGTP